jgi:protein TonB
MVPPAAEPAAVTAPPAPSVTYHGSLGLNPPPRPLTDIEQVVPEAAGLRGGTVVLRLFINEQGGVDKVEVLRSTPPGLFDATALEAASRARFSPGFLGGVPVKSQVTFEVNYKALGSGNEAGARTY